MDEARLGEPGRHGNALTVRSASDQLRRAWFPQVTDQACIH